MYVRCTVMMVQALLHSNLLALIQQQGIAENKCRPSKGTDTPLMIGPSDRHDSNATLLDKAMFDVQAQTVQKQTNEGNSIERRGTPGWNFVSTLFFG